MSKPKFIIKDDEFILGKVELHRDLTKNHIGIKGGGWWEMNDSRTELLLYGMSTDFGSVTKQQVIEVFNNGYVPRVLSTVEKVFFTPMPLLDLARVSKELILELNQESV